jgi:peptidoglycan/LPS O-acetylase OafA/YrhL
MFRKDINGLRFIAVISVVFFHFSITGFSGGYSGVDIFFVISGFLMNEISIKVKDDKSWFISFYKKRFNRIYPALIFSILFSILISLVNTPPSELVTIKNQVLSALTFSSNLYYLKNTSSYFSGLADSYLLLHTWSLAVEFQFYALFPIAFWLSHKCKNKNIIYSVMILVSFILCLFLVRHHQKPAFYLLPFRAWELFLGAYVSNLPSCKLNNTTKRIIESFLVLSLLLFTIFINENSNWPGIYTLIPTLATAIYLYVSINNEDTILRFKPIQYIGRASYSIYLYHWPIVYYLYQSQINHTSLVKFFSVLASIALGFLSYNFVEKKIKTVNIKVVLSAIGVAILIVFISTLNITKYYLPENVLALDEYSNYGESAIGIHQFGNKNKTCFLTSGKDDIKFYTADKCLSHDNGKKNLLLLGDSHAAEFSEAMNENFKEYNIIQVTASGCAPLIKTSGPDRCVDLMKYFYSSILPTVKFDLIFVSANWYVFSKDANENNLSQTNNILKKNATNVFFIGQTRAFDAPFYKLAQRNNSATIIKHTIKDCHDYNQRMLTNLPPEINYINMFDAGINTDGPDFFIKKIPMMFDDNHFTYEWSTYLTKKIFIPLANHPTNSN